MKKGIFFFFALLFALSFTVCAGNILSPALDVIASDNSMVKAGVTSNGELCFDVDDFDLALGVNVSSITVTSLPHQTAGRLMLDNLYVVENQVIYREDFSILTFIATDADAEASFNFRANGSIYEIECSLLPLESVNLPPVASNGSAISTSTNSNISCYDVLKGFDPEGDMLRFEIVSLPKKGLVSLTNRSTGDYKYTPYINARGTDTFSYRVRDSFGNYSETCVVEISIEKYNDNIVFSELDERYLNAVIALYENGYIDCATNEAGELVFASDELITKEELVKLVMDVMGAKNVPTVTHTRFADDSEISSELKGYLECAYSLGIIKGKNEADGLHIEPKANVTTAEAAVIINNIIGADIDTSLTVFADDSEIPEWAKDAITSLTELGILKKADGKISPNAPLTKAQVAQILKALLEYRGKI